MWRIQASACGLSDDERGMAHPQARVAPLLAVVPGTPQYWHEEQGKVGLRVGQVLGVQGPQQGIGGHAGVEAVDQGGEERLAAPALEGASPRVRRISSAPTRL